MSDSVDTPGRPGGEARGQVQEVREQEPHVAATLAACTGACTSVTARTPCAPWQLAHVATRVSPRASRVPCPLAAYSIA